MRKKICKIINARLAYILEVDDTSIPFSGGVAADYFKEHYAELGYKILCIKED